jgi:hypothetical protein
VVVGRIFFHFSFVGVRGRVRFVFEVSTVHTESGQSLFYIQRYRGRDEKVRGWGLQLCFDLFILYKMECLKDAVREPRASQVKDSEKLLVASVTIVVGGSDVDPNLLSKMEVSITKECVAGLCALERGHIILHLHMQMVVKFHISNLKMLNKILSKSDLVRCSKESTR